MKVAMFSVYPSEFEKPPGGVCAVTVVLARALARFEDIDIHVVTLEGGRTDVGIDHDGDVTIHRLPRPPWPQILDILVGPGRKRLLHYLERLQPDLLHSHETYGLTLGKCPYPHVFTIHGFNHANLIAASARHARIRSRLWRLVERHGLAGHEHIISITPYVRAMIEPLATAEIHDIDNPVDERFFSVEPRPQPGRILCVGWINERKNTLGAIEALHCVIEGGIDATLVVAGQPHGTETQYLERVKARIKEHRLQDRVELLGHVNHNKLFEELTTANVFLLASRQENSPMAIAEAMAAGVPVVSSNRCGMPFMVREGETGFLVDPESTEQIAARLSQLLASPETCRQMGRKAREVAITRFHPDAVARKTRDVYRTLLRSAESTPQPVRVGG